MKLPAITSSIALSLILTGFSLCYGGSITTSTEIEIGGILRLKDSALCFADGTCQTSAVFSDGSAIWGQITGFIDNQIDLSEKFTTKEDRINKNVPNGYAGLDNNGLIPVNLLPSSFLLSFPVAVAGTSPTWFTQGAIWQELPEFTVYQNFLAPYKISVDLVENVGVQGTARCNLGIFVDDSPTPVCYGFWSGSAYSATFRQERITCEIGTLPIGQHTFTVKHRSEFCTYGNYWLDEFSSLRSFSLGYKNAD